MEEIYCEIVSVISQSFFFFPFFCVLHKHLFSILTTILLVLFSKCHLSYTIQRFFLSKVYNHQHLQCLFSSCLSHSYNRSWNNGVRHQNILKYSFKAISSTKENPFVLNTQTSINKINICISRLFCK